MNFDLNEDQSMVRDMVRKFARDQVAPHAHVWDDVEALSSTIAESLAENGLLAVTASPDIGGSGLDTLSLMLVVEELSRASAALGMAVAAHNTIVVPNAIDPQAYFDQSLLHGWAMPGIVPRVADQNGALFMSGDVLVANPFGASNAVIFAEFDESLEAFLVPLDALEPETTLGLRGLRIRALKLTSAPTKRAACKTDLNAMRASFAAVAVGIAQAALAEALAYARERVQFGRPLTAFQATQFKLANMGTELEAARLVMWGSVARGDAALALSYASRVCNTVVDEALQLHGGYGYTVEYPVERLYRDAKMFLPYLRT